MKLIKLESISDAGTRKAERKTYFVNRERIRYVVINVESICVHFGNHSGLYIYGTEQIAAAKEILGITQPHDE